MKRVIENCNHCDFKRDSMDGEYCSHPELKVKPYDDMICESHRIPDKCPLRKKDFIVQHTIKNK